MLGFNVRFKGDRCLDKVFALISFGLDLIDSKDVGSDVYTFLFEDRRDFINSFNNLCSVEDELFIIVTEAFIPVDNPYNMDNCNIYTFG